MGEEELRLVVKRPRKRGGLSMLAAVAAEKANDVWNADFQFRTTITGKPLKILSIVDQDATKCLGAIID